MDNKKIKNKVRDYFKFMQNMLEKTHGNKDKKTLFKIIDKEKGNFFKQVRELWKKQRSK